MHIGLSDVLFSIINFLVLMFVLYKCCWKMVVRVMKERQQGITDSLQKAEDAKKEAEDTHTMLQTEISNARREARKIVEESKKAGESVKQDIIKGAYAAAEEITARAEMEIERRQKEAVDALQTQVADMVVTVTEKLLKENLSEEQQLALVDKYIAEVGDVNEK
ncbi:MAG: F0F1 ATP synthase subunit B [Bacillota bacterium]|jgi:F-type H+-transporting ATPase subunit b